MKNIYNALRIIIEVIAVLIFLAGIVLTGLGAYELIEPFTHLQEISKEHLAPEIAMKLLSGIDMFLIAVVFFVFALGMMVLFVDPNKPLPVKLPEWLRLKNFIQLKVILWEAILTTLVIFFLTRLVGRSINNQQLTPYSLIIPGGILMIALSLYFLKKG